MLVEPVFLGRLQGPIGVDPWRVLDVVLAVGNDDIVSLCPGSFQGYERFGHSEKARPDGYPARLSVFVVYEDLADGADLFSVF